MKSYYSLHNIVNFSVTDRSGWHRVLRGNDVELQGFSTSEAASEDFSVYLGKFTPGTQGSVILDNRVFIKDDYLYGEGSSRYARWEFEMSGFECGDTKLRIHTGFLGSTLISEMLIYPLIWLKLNKKGYPVIHASGAVKNGKAVVFAGRGAAGKSTITMSLIKRGYDIMGDHFVILHEGKAHSFPSPLHLMDFNLHPVVAERMTSSMKRALRWRRLFQKLTGHRLATKINLDEILSDKMVDVAELNKLYIVIPGETFNVKTISKEEVVQHLVFNQKLEQNYIDRYMMEYSFLFPESNLACYWTEYEKNLSAAIPDQTTVFRIETPRRLDNAVLNEIGRIIG